MYVFQPVGFVTFSSRVAAEAAKQDLQVIHYIPPPVSTGCGLDQNLWHIVELNAKRSSFHWNRLGSDQTAGMRVRNLAKAETASLRCSQTSL